MHVALSKEKVLHVKQSLANSYNILNKIKPFVKGVIQQTKNWQGHIIGFVLIAEFPPPPNMSKGKAQKNN